MKKFSFLVIVVSSLLITISGCASNRPTTIAESPAATEMSVTPSPTAVVEPQAPTSMPLGENITLPDGWTMEQAVSISEVEALVNDTGYAFFPEASSDAAGGNPSGGFVKKNANGNLKLTFLVFTKGKEEKYNFFKDYVVEGTLREISSELWDKAFIGDFKDNSAAVVVLKGDVCTRINWFPEAYPQFDKTEFGTRLATLLINNLYGGERQIKSSEEINAAETNPQGDLLERANSNIPDKLPEELKDAPELNEYAVKLWMDYVKPNIFEAPLLSDEEKENARKALKLIIAAEDKAIALYSNNEHMYYLRGNSYAKCYYDTKNADYKEKALADLKEGRKYGLAIAQTEYDKLSAK